ncbi:hypothetical protein Trydic_g5497 [Trypoxylus dichotomus]
MVPCAKYKGLWISVWTILVISHLTFHLLEVLDYKFCMDFCPQHSFLQYCQSIKGESFMQKIITGDENWAYGYGIGRPKETRSSQM